jgi:hypothetical protein
MGSIPIWPVTKRREREMSKYFGNFSSREDVAREFGQTTDRWGDNEAVYDTFPTEEQILFAVYDTPDYDGYGFVLLKIDGVLYEVHGSHCSCYGLEDQWELEETTIEALRMRPRDSYRDYSYGVKTEAMDAYLAIIDSM